MKATVTFHRGRKGDLIARWEGRVAFPARECSDVEEGREYEVLQARPNRRGTAYFLVVRPLPVERVDQVDSLALEEGRATPEGVIFTRGGREKLAPWGAVVRPVSVYTGSASLVGEGRLEPADTPKGWRVALAEYQLTLQGLGWPVRALRALGAAEGRARLEVELTRAIRVGEYTIPAGARAEVRVTPREAFQRGLPVRVLGVETRTEAREDLGGSLTPTESPYGGLAWTGGYREAQATYATVDVMGAVVEVALSDLPLELRPRGGAR